VKRGKGEKTKRGKEEATKIFTPRSGNRFPLPAGEGANQRKLWSIFPLEPFIGEDNHYSSSSEKGKNTENYEESSIWVHDLISIRAPRGFVNASGFGI